MYKKFLQIIERQFGLQIVEQHSPVIAPQPVVPSFSLLYRLEMCMDMVGADSNEITRSSSLIAPLLLELRATKAMSLFVGNGFEVDQDKGLDGCCDYLISGSFPQKSTISPPVKLIVEAKSHNLNRGISHCLVQMVAAQKLNSYPEVVYGAATTGTLWRFLKLEGTEVRIDLTEYPFPPIEQVLAFLGAMLD